MVVVVCSEGIRELILGCKDEGFSRLKSFPIDYVASSAAAAEEFRNNKNQ